MPPSENDGRVSVGLFSARDGAERRARAVRSLGLDAQIEERPAIDAGHWLDVELDATHQTLSMDGLQSIGGANSRVAVQECPAAVKSRIASPAPDVSQPRAQPQSKSPAARALGSTEGAVRAG